MQALGYAIKQIIPDGIVRIECPPIHALNEMRRVYGARISVLHVALNLNEAVFTRLNDTSRIVMLPRLDGGKIDKQMMAVLALWGEDDKKVIARPRRD